MKHEAMAIVAAIAAAITLLILYVLGHQWVPSLNKFIGGGV